MLKTGCILLIAHKKRRLKRFNSHLVLIYLVSHCFCDVSSNFNDRRLTLDYQNQFRSLVFEENAAGRCDWNHIRNSFEL